MSTLGQYRATPETLNDGEQRFPRLDSSGALVLGSGGGGGAVTIADGADVAEGATSATAYSDTTAAASGTVVGLLKGIYKLLLGAGTNAQGIKVTGVSAVVAVVQSPAAAGTGTQAGLYTVSENTKYNGATWDFDRKANATGRLLSSAATTNGTSLKATAGDLFKVVGNNTVASKRYLKFYNKASAPTVGTDTPVLTIVLPASAAFDIPFVGGQYFGTGIAYAITGAAADADTTAISAGDIECLNLTYA